MDPEELSRKLVGYKISDYGSVQNLPTLELESNDIENIEHTLQLIKSLRRKKNNTFEVSDQQDNKCADQKNKYNADEVRRTNKILYRQYQEKQSSDLYQKMLAERQRLPAWKSKDEITATVANSRVVIISGMTGCGKTTQVPQFILDAALQHETFNTNIICTQPRRISATSIAERVATERADDLGKLVGYQIRLDGDVSQYTRLLFCTTGIVLRRLESDPDLEGVTHLIIDEVHERSELSDFLILIVKKLLTHRPDLKVILMSATINAKLFSQYFDNCPVIDIPGQIFPVKQLFFEDILERTKYHLDIFSDYTKSEGEMMESRQALHGYRDHPTDKTPDSKLPESQLKWRYPNYSHSTIQTLATMKLDEINYHLLNHLLLWLVTKKHDEFPQDGSILVFLPGYQEIQKAYDNLMASEVFSKNHENYIVIPLHSSFSAEEQKAVFYPPKPGVRKIVLSTNIAETSITIDDIVFVVDVGFMKEMRYDHSKSMQSLDLIRVSKTNADQRKGRAGRVREGVCFHMFTSHMYHHELRAHPVPEIQRNSLEQVVIRTKILPIFRKQNVESVLQDLIEPPPVGGVHGAVQRLKDLGALDSKADLTALGYHVGSLPVDVKIGKLILYGTIFRCLDSTLTIAAVLSYKSPFITPFKKKEIASAKKKELMVQHSDLLTMVRAYKEWWDARKTGGEKAGFDYCREYFLSYNHLEMIATLKQQFVEILSDIGFLQKGIKLKDVKASGALKSDGVAIITGKLANNHNDKLDVLSSMLVAGLYPNIIQAFTGNSLAVRASAKNFKTRTGDTVDIHPSSVNFKEVFQNGSFFVYHEKVKTKKIYIRECSLVENLPLLMFAGGSLEVSHSEGYMVLTVDEIIKFKSNQSKAANALKDLRTELDQLLVDKIVEPDLDLTSSEKSNALISCIICLITDN